MALRGGRYEILGTIAAGGMATVHLGRALGAGGFERLVAVKTMHPHLAREAEFVAMFLDEARLAARIRHPNVVATLDIQQDAEGLFLVMEYVEGPALSRMLKEVARESRRLPLDVALRIFTDTLAGLHAAHELTGPDGEPLHLIHRDMSPHNVLVGTDGIARITDFGVARAESRLATTRTGSVKGKVTYMAPEQVQSQPLDRRVDIYAAGALLWEMLTGERLVRADSDLAAMHMIMQSERRAPHEVDSSVPEALSAAAMRAVARDREQRYPTAAAFAEAVEAAAAASGVTIAAPRAVAQAVRALGVHKPPEVTPSSRRSPGGEPSIPDASSGPAVAAASAASLPARVDATPPSVGTHAAFESLADAAEKQPQARRRVGLLLGLAGAAVTGAVVALAVVTGGPPASGEAPAAPGGGAGLSPVPEAPATAALAPAVIPADTAPSASASATAAASASASATAGQGASTGGHTGAATGNDGAPATGHNAGPATGGAQRPAVAPTRPSAPAGTTTGPRSFRPKEL